MHHQGVPDAQPHRGGAGRHQRGARQHGRGRLALSFLRHRQGLRLAGRPGRDRVHVQGRTVSRDRARALRRAVLAHRGRPHLPAAVRRHDDALRQGHRATNLRGRRPHRARDAAHALSAVAQARGAVFRRVLRDRPDHAGWRLPRRRRARHGRRLAAPFPRANDDPRNRWLRPCVFHLYLGAHLYRRRQRHGAARRAAAAGHGVRSVSSDRDIRRGLPDHRGRARRRRLPHELGRRAIHGALRSERQGSRLARRRVPGDDDRDQRGPRRRRASGPHPPAPRAPGPRGHQGAAAGDRRNRADLRRCRRDPRADSRTADRALQHGRHPLQRARRGRDARRRSSRMPSCPV